MLVKTIRPRDKSLMVSVYVENHIRGDANFVFGDKMGRMDIILPDDLEKRLREAVFQRKGLKKGNIKEAVSEAIILWLERGEKVKTTKTQYKTKSISKV